jgi:hypothetical protein
MIHFPILLQRETEQKHFDGTIALEIIDSVVDDDDDGAVESDLPGGLMSTMLALANQKTPRKR